MYYLSIGEVHLRGYNFAWFGRALEWHSRGQEFDPLRLHQKMQVERLAFFYPLRKQWYITSRQAYIINRRLYKRFRNDDIQRLAPLMICNSNGIDDMHGFAVISPTFEWVFLFYGYVD